MSRARTRPLVFSAIVCAVLVCASPSHAETWTASADSSRDPALPAAQDISHVESIFDDETGTWSVELTTYAEADDSTRAAINATLFGTPTAGFACGAHPDDALAITRANTLLSDTSLSGSVWTTSPPHRADLQSRDGSRLLLTDATLVGRRPVCANVNLSRNRVLDGVLLAFSSPSAPAPPGGGQSPSEPEADPLVVRFTHPEARMSASRSGVVTIALDPFARAVSGSVTVRRGSVSIGQATFRARANAPVLARVKLNPAARRTLAAGRRLSVRLFATAAGITRSTRATILPRSEEQIARLAGHLFLTGLPRTVTRFDAPSK